LSVDQDRQRLEMRGFFQGAGAVVDIDDLIAGSLQERLDPLP